MADDSAAQTTATVLKSYTASTQFKDDLIAEGLKITAVAVVSEPTVGPLATGDSASGDDGMSAGAIAGIVVSIVVLLALAGVAIWLWGPCGGMKTLQEGWKKDADLNKEDVDPDVEMKPKSKPYPKSAEQKSEPSGADLHDCMVSKDNESAPKRKESTVKGIASRWGNIEKASDS